MSLLRASRRVGGMCAVCAWDDRDIDWLGQRARLIEAQREFARSGAYDPAVVALARPPRPDEARPAWWRSLDDEAAALCALFEAAFAEVELDGGVSLAEAELIDDYALPSRDEHDPPPRGHGAGPRWQDLTRDEIDRYPWGNFTFQDARGIRYHLPAFVCAHLRGEPVAAMESLHFVLEQGHQLDAIERLLSAEQRAAVARFLAFCHGHRGLRDRWGKYLDPDHLAAIRAPSAWR